ncbi:hypothetical protein MTZ49_07430 [Entomomonas sp. E2T0]|uniref:hypothetical protein n=1 Tax=Entomomonas sp. E2T0 TaxID=2930213 RepID=UPI00222837CC|nr:hypothetical protein [Entomomonas sp. E2T0]UYZ85370.1 hypothetical protein MTZ49_07430 [Entomomonas sp. E2T0]
MTGVNTPYPTAGIQSKGLTTRYLALAPLPIPTGYPPIVQIADLKQATATYMDYGKGNYWGFEFGVRAQISWFMMLFFALFAMHIVVAATDSYPFFYAFFIYVGPVMLQLYAYSLGGSFLFFSFITISGYFKAAKQIPLRFNRERREVCAVVGKEVFIAPWESISVQLETALLMSQYSATQHVTLTFQIPDINTGRQATYSMGYGVEGLAIADWEAIRVFMEYGLETLKKQTGTPDLLEPEALKKIKANPQPTFDYYYKLAQQCQEGSLEYFYVIKNQNKYSDSKVGYFFWIVGHILSGWTFPCHLAEWLNRKNFVKRPKAMLTWSQPIAKEQWEKPSLELIEQSNILLATYGKNNINNLKDYFSCQC